jgi:hypothetical protein
MFAGTKVETIGALTVWYFTNAVGSILAYKATITRAAAATKTTRRSTHTTLQIVFYTQQNHIFIT